MRKTLVLGSAVLLLATPALGAAPQVGQTTLLQVSAHVVRKCIIQVGPIAFGDYDGLVVNSVQPLDKDDTLIVTCSRGIAAKVDIGPGANAQGQTRRMAGGGEFLTYEIYTDATHATVWGSGAQSRSVQAVQSAGGTNPITAYGRIAAGQFVTPGNYADTATVIINF